MTCIIHLKDTQTGEVRQIHEDAGWPGDERCATEYMWTEGNYACDCNRGLFYARAAGEPDPEHTGCSDTRYVIVKVTDPDGTDLGYSEPEQPAAEDDDYIPFEGSGPATRILSPEESERYRQRALAARTAVGFTFNWPGVAR